MRKLIAGVVLGVLAVPAAAADPDVTLTEATTAAVDAAIASHKGKVVLVDVWFLACSPCVKKFPHLVELHKKYGPDGLVCVTVDRLADELKRQDKGREFLKKQGAAFPNYILKDAEDAVDGWLTKHGLDPQPAVGLWDRAGKRVKLSDDPTDEEVEAAIRKALAEK